MIFFAWPAWLAGILAVILGGILLWRHARRMLHRRLAAFAAPKRLMEMLASVDWPAKNRKGVLILASLALIALALARPLTGPRPDKAERKGVDVFVALDISKSMLAEDVAPFRLAAVKKEILEWIETLHGDRIGLILFSGEAFIQAPLTFDFTALGQALRQASPSAISRGGTNIPEALKIAVASFHRRKQDDRIVMIVSDGENLEGDAVEAARRAYLDEKVRVFTVGVGTLEGGKIPKVARSAKERAQPLKNVVRDEYGLDVVSRLDARALRAIAAAGGGMYFEFEPGKKTWEALYTQGLMPLAKKSETLDVNDFYEWFQIPLALAVIFLLGEMLVLTRRAGASVSSAAVVLPPPSAGPVAATMNTPKRTPAATPPSARKHPAPASKASARTLAILFLWGSIVLAAQANDEDVVKMAEALVAAGKAAQAADMLQVEAQKAPDNVYILYNYGIAAYAAKRFDVAVDAFSEVARSQDARLRSQAMVHLGNTQYRLGQMLDKANKTEGAILAWERSSLYYRTAVNESGHADARRNLGVVTDKLEGLLMKHGNAMLAEAGRVTESARKRVALEKALSDFQKVLELNPENLEARDKLEKTRRLLVDHLASEARAAAERGDQLEAASREKASSPDASKKDRDDAAKKEKESVQARTGAVEKYDQAIQLDPENAALRREQADLKNKLSDQLTASAENDLDAAKQAGAKELPKMEKAVADALGKLDQAIAQNEYNQKAKDLKADAMKQLEDALVAKGQAQMAASEKPATKTEAAAGHLDDALQNFNKALAMNPESKPAQEGSRQAQAKLAEKHAEIGKQELARAEAMASKSASPSSQPQQSQTRAPSAMSQQALQQLIGHLEKAEQNFAQAQALGLQDPHLQQMQQQANEQLAGARNALSQAMQASQSQPSDSQDAGEGMSAQATKPEDQGPTQEAAQEGGQKKAAILGFSSARKGSEQEGNFQKLEDKRVYRDW